MTDKAKRIEIRNDDKGGFDELLASGASVHFEMMDNNCLWVGIETADEMYGMWISARGRLTVNLEDQSAFPTPSTEEETR